MRKVVSISTKEPPTWESWKELKRRDDPSTARLTITQSEALAIFQEVLASLSMDDAVQILKTTLPSRKAFTYWLGQVGHRQDARLGKGKGFLGYVRSVVESLCNRGSVHKMPSEREEGKVMGKKDGRPTVIVRKNRSRNAAVEPSEKTERASVSGGEEVLAPAGNEETKLAVNGPEEVQEGYREDVQPAAFSPRSTDADLPQGSLTVSSSWPQVPGFHLEGATLNHQYAIRRMVVLCDCCVKGSPEGIFDVLGRNFNHTGELMWWLRKIGKSHVADLVKGKDIVDAIRKAAYELFRELKQEIGRPIARW